MFKHEVEDGAATITVKNWLLKIETRLPGRTLVFTA